MAAQQVDDQTSNLLNGFSQPSVTPGASVEPLEDGILRLSIPGGPAGAYSVAQVDDTRGLARRDFNWQPPFSLSLSARVSAADLPGTWGFGFWNDPFSASLGLKAGSRKLPALPNAAWFFHASPQNYLSLRDDLPGSGFLAAVFSSSLTPTVFLSPAVIGLPLLAWRPAARLIRHAARCLIKEDAVDLKIDPSAWHDYGIDTVVNGTTFSIDNESVLQTTNVPRGRLGLVIWIDNQFAAFNPQGQLHYGTLKHSDPAWLEVRGIQIRC